MDGVSDEVMWLVRVTSVLVQRLGGEALVTEEDIAAAQSDKLMSSVEPVQGGYRFRLMPRDPDTVRRLFIGGPWHEQMEYVPAKLHHVKVLDTSRMERAMEDAYPTSFRTAVYRKVRMGHSGVKETRTLMLVDGMPEELGQRLLNDYLGRRWVEEAPDA